MIQFTCEQETTRISRKEMGLPNERPFVKGITAVPKDQIIEEDPPMEIYEITSDKKSLLPLLLLADEQEEMVDRYLSRGRMFVLDDHGIRCECVVTDEGNGILEIKNIATVPDDQGKGYAKALIRYLLDTFRDRFTVLQVGTGDSPLTIPFYEKCGFVRSHVIPNFFTEHYDHPIIECGIRLTDMIILRRPF